MPVQRSATEVNQWIVPPLARPLRGPPCTLGDPRVFTLSLWVLDTGRPWTCWPGPTAREGPAAIHSSTVDTVFATWADDGSMAHALVARVGHLSAHHQLALRLLHGDGTHMVATQGGEGIGDAGPQHPKGAQGIASIDHTGAVLAPRPVAPVNEAETGWWPEGLQALKRVARLTGLGRTDASLTRDGGGESRPHRQALVKAGRMPNLQEHPRHRTTTTRGRQRLFHDAMQA